VAVNNTHPNADAASSEIYQWLSFAGPDQDLLIWGTSGFTVQPVGNGTVSAGQDYSDFTAFGAFQATEVRWRVTVPPGTAEGTYRAIITITLWSG
jgi:hypothetical protein